MTWRWRPQSLRDAGLRLGGYPFVEFDACLCEGLAGLATRVVMTSIDTSSATPTRVETSSTVAMHPYRSPWLREEPPRHKRTPAVPMPSRRRRDAGTHLHAATPAPPLDAS
jgi:hypothetical protein